MPGRLEGKIAIVVGAGQGPGESKMVGNGRAVAILYAREGAKVLAVDRDPASNTETVRLIREEKGTVEPFEADVTKEATLQAMIEACMTRWGRIDILHNNVGISVGGGDAPPTEITEATFDKIMTTNLRGIVIACKHAIPIMRKQKSGVIINISSMAAFSRYPGVAYKASKAALVAYTKQLAIQNAEFGIRANVILPGLMDTPMAVDTRARTWKRSREDVAAERNAKVPLRHQMGTAWDVAYAALYLASDEANFVTGVALPVDGGSSCQVG